CRVRLAAITTATPTPVAADARAAASRASSTVAVRPPKRAAYPDGSIWISSQPEPSSRSSSAISRNSRRMSAGVRSTDRAVSYSRWNRNQPRSSAPLSVGGHSSTRAEGRWTPCWRARSTSVECRIAPVRCRCRCALGSWSSGRAIRLVCLPQQLADAGHAFFQVTVAQRAGQPEVTRRAERLTRHHRDLGLVQDERGQLGRRLRPLPVDLLAEQALDRRVAVERALGLRADHAADVVEHPGHGLPPP